MALFSLIINLFKMIDKEILIKEQKQSLTDRFVP